MTKRLNILQHRAVVMNIPPALRSFYTPEQLNINHIKRFEGAYFLNCTVDRNNRYMKHLYLLLLILFISTSSLRAQTIHPDCMDGTIYFKVYDTSTVQLVPYLYDVPQLNQVITAYGVDTMYQAFRTPDLSLQRVFRMDFQQSQWVDSLIADMQQLYFVEFAEKVDICLTTHIPNDFIPIQWHLPVIDANTAWDITTGSPSIVIAIVDNAVKTTHPDLIGNLWVNAGEVPNNGIDDDFNGYIDDINGYDVADGDNNPNPPASTTVSSAFNHGTHCAGIASAATNNNTGIASLGYNVKIMAVKCSPDTGGGSQLTASYQGIDYAIAAGADIISMSFGSGNAPFTGQLLINAAQARGITLVAAAGNAGTSNPFYPAAFNNVIAVGATNQTDQKAAFSNYGNYIDVMAPGVNIYSTLAGNNSYGSLSGTSMACPLVAGLAGLILSMNSALSPANVETIIESGSEDIYPQNPSYIGQLGAGRINAYNSLALLVSTPEITGEENILVAPNPSNGSFRVILKEMNANVQLRIIDLLGQVVHSEIMNASSTEINKELPQGIYMIELVKDGEAAGRTKIIIGN